jgi:hypothetical protein
MCGLYIYYCLHQDYDWFAGQFSFHVQLPALSRGWPRLYFVLCWPISLNRRKTMRFKVKSRQSGKQVA